MKRRTFVLRLVAATGALAVGWTFFPPRRRMGDGSRISEGPGETALNGWVKIGTDNTVTVIMSKSEMGQGIHTTLAMLLADELDADWSQVRVEMAPVGDPIYNNIATVVDGLPFHPDDHGLIQRTTAWLTAKTMREAGVMITGGSSSVKDLWLPMRQAGASTRALLVSAAAATWKVPESTITVAGGVLSHANGLRATFGQLITEASTLTLRSDAPLKSAAQFTLIGKPMRRLESAAKQRGTATFGIDVVLPGMQYASVVMCPVLGGTVASMDTAAARLLPGVKQVVAIDGHNGGTGGVAVIADTPWHAMKAAKSVKVAWSNGAMATVSSESVMRTLASTLDTERGHAYLTRGNVDDALAAAAKQVTAEYRAPFLAHATMEPINCTVQFADGRATVWASTQVPGLARRAVAKVLGIASDQVTMHVQLLGGGFGRRLDIDYIAQAAAIAQAAQGEPVQTIWSREEDIRHDFYRPACVSRFSAGLDASGKLLAWRNVSAGQSVVAATIGRYFGLPAGPIDKTTSEGSFDQPYEYPAVRVGHAIVELLVPTGFWRAVGHSHHGFFTESFMDEVAVAAKSDPIAFRLALLAKHPRHARVLTRVAELAGWASPLDAGVEGTRRGRGVALHESFGSVVAQVAEVTIAADNTLRVDRVVCVIDCGFPVNPNMIQQQVESAVVFGLSAALHGEITITDGRVTQGNFNDYRPLRMSECPAIVVDIIPSVEHPEGVGEPPLPPIAPAVANAIFAATGTRLRSLPLRLSER